MSSLHACWNKTITQSADLNTVPRFCRNLCGCCRWPRPGCHGDSDCLPGCLYYTRSQPWSGLFCNESTVIILQLFWQRFNSRSMCWVILLLEQQSVNFLMTPSPWLIITWYRSKLSFTSMLLKWFFLNSSSHKHYMIRIVSVDYQRK